MPPLTEGMACAIGVADDPIVGNEALIGVVPAAKAPALPAGDIALLFGHLALPTVITFQRPDGFLYELPLEPLG
ncbi:hypothetical protein CsSME_00036259 [Camellia sinensis var. sinensis]